MSARGLTTREVQGHLEELYGVEVSPTLISTITDAVWEDVRTWQNRPLEAGYPILYVDWLVVQSRQEGVVTNPAGYVALGVNRQGEKELLGLGVSETAGAKFWLAVFAELPQRGVQDCLVACVDGLAGFPEALETVFPHTQVQLCMVQQVRQSWRDWGLERAATGGAGAPGHLWGGDAARGRGRLGAIGSHVGGELPDDECDVAAGLESADGLL